MLCREGEGLVTQGDLWALTRQIQGAIGLVQVTSIGKKPRMPTYTAFPTCKSPVPHLYGRGAREPRPRRTGQPGQGSTGERGSPAQEGQAKMGESGEEALGGQRGHYRTGKWELDSSRVEAVWLLLLMLIPQLWVMQIYPR